MVSASGQAKVAARRAGDSAPVEALARAGLAARGVVYVLIGSLALEIAAGRHRKADRSGALTAIREQPLGGLLLVVLATAFAGYALWRLLEGLAGHRDAEAGWARTGRRAASLARAALYASFAVTTLRFAAGSRGGDATRSTTARALGEPGGRLIVGIVAAGVLVAGLVTAFRGLSAAFLDELDLSGAGRVTSAGVRLVGRVGLVGRGLVIALLGVFGIRAAVDSNPGKAKGLDAGLRSLAAHPAGELLLVAAALALVAFGLWSFAEARWRSI